MQKCLAVAVLAAASFGASADVIEGLTFSVVTDLDYFRPPVPYGYVVGGGDAVLMNWSNAEWEHGFSEFDLRRAASASTATLSYVFRDAAVGFGASPTGALAGATLDLASYVGDNRAAVTDYGLGFGPSFARLALDALAPGARVSLDVTSLYNAFVARGDAAFGVRLKAFGGAFSSGSTTARATFTDFSLTVTPLVSAVPEPATWALFTAGLAVLGGVAARRRAAGPSQAD